MQKFYIMETIVKFNKICNRIEPNFLLLTSENYLIVYLYGTVLENFVMQKVSDLKKSNGKKQINIRDKKSVYLNDVWS